MIGENHDAPSKAKIGPAIKSRADAMGAKRILVLAEAPILSKSEEKMRTEPSNFGEKPSDLLEKMYMHIDYRPLRAKYIYEHNLDIFGDSVDIAPIESNALLQISGWPLESVRSIVLSEKIDFDNLRALKNNLDHIVGLWSSIKPNKRLHVIEIDLMKKLIGFCNTLLEFSNKSLSIKNVG